MRKVQRGRISAAALLARVRSPDLAPTPARPDPPSELEADQAVEWKAIVARMPDDWFPRETWGLLIQYCRIKSRLDYLSRMVIEVQSDPKAAKELAPLFRLERQLSDTLALLSSKMRLCHSAVTIKERTPRNEVLSPVATQIKDKTLWDRERAA